jgi:hypothetical protein
MTDPNKRYNIKNAPIHPADAQACDQIDAALFTGDPSERKEKLDFYLWLIARWSRRLAQLANLISPDVSLYKIRRKSTGLLSLGFSQWDGKGRSYHSLPGARSAARGCSYLTPRPGGKGDTDVCGIPAGDLEIIEFEMVQKAVHSVER